MLVSLAVFLFFTELAQAAEKENILTEKIFSAAIVKIKEEKLTTMPEGDIVKQQNLEIRGIDGDYKDKTLEINGIGDPNGTNKNIYEVGDKVSIEASFDESGAVKFYITDYIRTGGLKWLAIIFIFSLLIIGRWKGVRSLVSLFITFFVMMKYIIPKIMDGADPIITTIIGSFIILLAIIYITDGFKKNSHIAAISISISLLSTVVISWIFVEATKLSGLANEEASFLVGQQNINITNFKGLLLAGIIIGALGVLDDVVLSQITAVQEIKAAGRNIKGLELFKRAYNVGIAHISSMTNTLFLAYAGASLPLLILFTSGKSSFSSYSQALNNELLATEIVRTLAGSIGLILAVPISTLLAVWWYNKER